VPDIKRLARDEWQALRDLRLTALADSPDAFLALYSDESKYTPSQWEAEFERGSWYICDDPHGSIGLIGATREPHTPWDECYLEFIWVSPGHRRSGIASDLVGHVLALLREAQCRTVHLWVLDGNVVATALYKKLGFVSSDERHALADRPGRSEERWLLALQQISE
jgi:ribosomal protein S18 acetylase RimI-like enzyme